MQLYPYVQSDRGEIFPSWPAAKEAADGVTADKGAQTLQLATGGLVFSLNCQVLPTGGAHEGDVCSIMRTDADPNGWFQYRDRGWRQLEGKRSPAPPLIEGLELPPEATFGLAYALLEHSRPFQLTDRSAQQFVEALRRTERDRQGGLIPWRDDGNQYRVVFFPGQNDSPGRLNVWMLHSVGRFIGSEGKHVRAIQQRLCANVGYIEAKSFEEE